MIVHLISGTKTYIEVVLGYLRISRSISDHGEIRERRGVYVVDVKLKKPFKDVAADIQSHFGRFAEIRRT
jgi:hypothetical protein